MASEWMDQELMAMLGQSPTVDHRAIPHPIANTIGGPSRVVPVPDLQFSPQDQPDVPPWMLRLAQGLSDANIQPQQLGPGASPLAGFLNGFLPSAANSFAGGVMRREQASPMSAGNRLALARLNQQRQAEDAARREKATKDASEAAKTLRQWRDDAERKAEKQAKAEQEAADRKRTEAERTPGTPEYKAWLTRERDLAAARREPKIATERGPLSTDSEPTTRKAIADRAANPYRTQAANRTIGAIDELIPRLDRWTTGVIGTALSLVPGTEASNVSADLAQVASNIAFGALQQMREASKTGGALGNVSERELDLLSSVEGSLRQNQSAENLKKNLAKIRESMLRVLEAAEAEGKTLPEVPQMAPAHSGGAVKWGRGKDGKPVAQ